MIDLRGEDISAQEAEALAAKYPGKTVLWDVPLSGGSRPSSAESLSLSSLSADDIPLFACFPNLKSIDASGCTDYEALLALRSAYPALDLTAFVTVGGKAVPMDAQRAVRRADTPLAELLDTLRLLCGDPRNRIVINSGRDKATLERWLGELPVTLAAEHGARYRENGVWHTRVARQQWNTGIMAILNLYLEKTPRSRLEVKDTALAWHYRECDPWLGELRAQQLTRALVSVCLRHKLQIIQGSKVLEIKSPEYSKGSEVRRLLEKGSYDFILAMGDDTTDDDMFEALPRDSFAVKVGSVSEKALYNMPQQERVLPFLRSLTEKVPDASEPSRKRPGRTAIRFVKRLLQTKNR